MEFYKHFGMKDGRLGKCKICTKNDTKTRADQLSLDQNWIKEERSRHREKYHRLEYREKHRPTPEMKLKAMHKSRSKFPEKYKAKSAAQSIKITKGNNRHHWSYNNEHFKDIIELTVMQHNFIHRFLVYDQSYKMYRKIDTMELLDTKEKHLEYINTIN